MELTDFPLVYYTNPRLQSFFFATVFLACFMFIWPLFYSYGGRPTDIQAFDQSAYEENFAELRAIKFNITLPPKGFLVWNEHCKIPRINPFTADVKRIYKPERKYNCTNKGVELISKIYDSKQRRYRLRVNVEYKDHFVGDMDEVHCCYQDILRNESIRYPEGRVWFAPCQLFHNETLIPRHVRFGVFVQCFSAIYGRIVFKDVFYVIQETSEIQLRLHQFMESGKHNFTIEHQHNEQKHNASKKDTLSLLYRFGIQLIGIDSLSQINFRRTMPKTFLHLLQEDWIELSGYTKINDNTFPNWMAVLCGLDHRSIEEICQPASLGGLNRCPMLFQLFSQNGCATAFSEDDTLLSTFNYGLFGMQKPVTDHYLRPVMLAAENRLPCWGTKRNRFCIGVRSAPDYVYGSAVEFAQRYAGKCSFGLFWTNSFSHEDFRTPSIMDTNMLNYLKTFGSTGMLENNVVIFFSDHGSRFGPLRHLPQGFMDSRLPVFFIWIPHRLRLEHPEFEIALRVNKYRLTTPYDVHMTLKHLLALTMGWSNETFFPERVSCPYAQTLLRPVPESRSCFQACVPDFYCTCNPFTSIPVTKKIIKMTKFVVAKINSFLHEKKVTHLCKKLKLRLVLAAYSRAKDIPSFNDEPNKLQHGMLYRTFFEVTYFHSEFEAILTYDSHTKSFHLNDVMNDITRLTLYAETSKCLHITSLKKFCFCK